jgi:hypothetical protein
LRSRRCRTDLVEYSGYSPSPADGIGDSRKRLLEVYNRDDCCEVTAGSF